MKQENFVFCSTHYVRKALFIEKVLDNVKTIQVSKKGSVDERTGQAICIMSNTLYRQLNLPSLR